MRYRPATTFMGLVFGCLALVGCASPYTYYGDDGCGGPGALSGRYGGGVAACDDCDTVAMEPAPMGAACGSCAETGPFCDHTITGLLRGMVTCNSGCGDIYWGEWSHDPPDSCDPCNNHGDFVGPRGRAPSCWQRLWSGLHGARHGAVDSATGCGACRDLGCGMEPGCGMESGCGCDDCGMPASTMFEGDVYESSEPFLEQLEPVPARQQQQPQDTSASVLRSTSRPYYAGDPNSRLVRRPGR